MKLFFLFITFLSMLVSQTFAQDTQDKNSIPYIIPATALSWKEKSKPINYLGMESYVNSGNLYKSPTTKLWTANSFTWEIYYAASMPKYDWISIGTGLEVGGSIGRDNEGTVYDRTGNESFYFVFQAYLNVSPWFTLHTNSDGRIEFRSRYIAKFSNRINGNFDHFLLSEFIFGFFIAGNEINVNTGEIDKFWISSPSLEFLYYIQFHNHVGFRFFSKFYVNNGLFYKGTSGITPNEIIPMEFYARFDFILGNGVTLWVRAQWNIYNSDFNAWAFFPDKNPFDIQIRAGLIFILDFTSKSKLNI